MRTSANTAFFLTSVHDHPRGTFTDTRVLREPADAAPKSYPVYLTPREHEVLALLSEGLPNKLISRRLEIAGSTVKAHIASILRALNVSSRLQAVVAAYRLGLLETERRAGAEALDGYCIMTGRR